MNCEPDILPAEDARALARLCLRLAAIVAIALAASILAATRSASAQMIDMARPEAMIGQIAQTVAGRPHAAPERRIGLVARGDVQRAIERTVCARIGCSWAPVALRIAKIESGYRCNARNGRAIGIFQNTDPARFGVSRAAALTCAGGISAGVAHMAMCARLGAHDAASMMRCHNSGSPFGRVDRVYRIALRGR